MPLDKPILRVSKPSEVPGHSMYGDWALPGREYSYIALFDLAKKHMLGKPANTILFGDICAKPGDWFGGDDFSGERYEAADPQYPGILIHAMPNPAIEPIVWLMGGVAWKSSGVTGLILANSLSLNLQTAKSLFLIS